jgi:hypothetical protein
VARYLLSVYQPDGAQPPPPALEKIMKKVALVRREMQSAGVLVLTAGLAPPAKASVVRPRDGRYLVTDGPFAETKEFLGGFTIVETSDLDAALAWARKLAGATTLPIEVRELHLEGQGTGG